MLLKRKVCPGDVVATTPGWREIPSRRWRQPGHCERRPTLRAAATLCPLTNKAKDNPIDMCTGKPYGWGFPESDRYSSTGRRVGETRRCRSDGRGRGPASPAKSICETPEFWA